MPRIYSIRSREVFKLLEKLGYDLDHTTGSHKIYKDFSTNKIIVVPNHTKDLRIGTVKSIIRELGLSQKDFLDFI